MFEKIKRKETQHETCKINMKKIIKQHGENKNEDSNVKMLPHLDRKIQHHHNNFS